MTRTQLLELGATPEWVKRQARMLRLDRRQRDVFLVPPHEWSWHARAMAGCLICRQPVAVSHWTAARLRGLDVAYDEPSIHLLMPDRRRPELPSGYVAHFTSRFGPPDRAWFEGLPVTTVARTMVDLAARLRGADLHRAVDDAIVRRVVPVTVLEATAARLRRRGHSGARLVAEALAPWRSGTYESPAEAETARLLARAGLPAPAAQYTVAVEGRFVARVDFAWPSARLALEVDGFSAHDGPRKFAADRERWNRLRGAGWDVLPVTVGELRRGQSGVLEVLRRRLVGHSVSGDS